MDTHVVGNGPLGASSALRRLVVARSATMVGLAYIAVIHIMDAGGKWEESRYIFWLYMALVVGAIVSALLLLRAESRRAWSLAAVVAVAPIIGYVLDRSTGLPNASGDIGNWGEPLGVLSLLVEGLVLALALSRLAMGRPANKR